jgi:predicted transcriptional regulator
MAVCSVQIRPDTEKALEELAMATGETIPNLVHRAVEELKRKEFLEGLAADFAALQSRPEEWAEELEERAAWECTLADSSE